MSGKITEQRWPNIEFTNGGLERLEEVASFLRELTNSCHPVHLEATEDFIRKMEFLDDYGGPVSRSDRRRRFRVRLGRGWSPYSFSVLWEQLDLQIDDYLFAFSGGLIWHGGSRNANGVYLASPCFGVHT